MVEGKEVTMLFWRQGRGGWKIFAEGHPRSGSWEKGSTSHRLVSSVLAAMVLSIGLERTRCLWRRARGRDGQTIRNKARRVRRRGLRMIRRKIKAGLRRVRGLSGNLWRAVLRNEEERAETRHLPCITATAKTAERGCVNLWKRTVWSQRKFGERVAGSNHRSQNPSKRLRKRGMASRRRWACNKYCVCKGHGDQGSDAGTTAGVVGRCGGKMRSIYRGGWRRPLSIDGHSGIPTTRRLCIYMMTAGMGMALAWSFTPYYECQRYGEAKHPGPYSVGGASSSGQACANITGRLAGQSEKVKDGDAGFRVGEAANLGPYAVGGASSSRAATAETPSARDSKDQALPRAGTWERLSETHENGLGMADTTWWDQRGMRVRESWVWLHQGPLGKEGAQTAAQREKLWEEYERRQAEDKSSGMGDRLPEGMRKEEVGKTEELRRRMEVNRLKAIERRKAKELRSIKEDCGVAHAATGAQPSTGKQESGRRGRFPSCFDEDFQEPWDPWIEDAEDVEPPVGVWYFGADELRWPREERSHGVGQKKEECSPFIPAEKFMGMKECMAFKSGPQGLGY